MQVQKLPTGIEGFDDVCHGGLPNARSTLVSGTSGTGKTVFSLQYLHHGICNFNEAGIFVTFEESPLLQSLDNAITLVQRKLTKNMYIKGLNILYKILI